MSAPRIFGDRVIVDLVVLHKWAQRLAVQKTLVRKLSERLEAEHILLRSALHELALARGEDPAEFIRDWQRERRKPPSYEDA